MSVPSPFSSALAALAESQYEGAEAFLTACSTLRILLLGATDAKRRSVRRTNPRIASVIGVAGIEEAMLSLGFREEGERITLDDSVDRFAGVALLDSAAGGVRRHGLAPIQRTSDTKGWSAELHAPCVLDANPKFKGAVLDLRPRDGAPSGVLAFHNSPFSNWWPCGASIEFCHLGVSLRFATSEAILMAFKQHLLAPMAGVAPHASLAAALGTHAAIHSPAESKEVAARATRRASDYTWWAHHGVHVLVGAAVCLLKFSQDVGLRRLLLRTQGVLIVEAAPHDGAWGVAMNTSQALRAVDELPRRFGPRSEAQDPVQFDVGANRIIRPSCEANALGKALMVARDALLAGADAPASMELRDAVALAARQMRLDELPVDWECAERKLADALTASV
uniref:NADAR domain-containing protein n=1 Tax=Prymnesium polylepis TaxID=72548 RepID=A0A6V4VBC5_9EUKA|mmetsp:Transcript_36228/g.90570  ORF Transcript_36228/g.90570 Transcript_36228/m.90570 type:complete len:394 (+) Transcript_36228:32-1213(+)